MLIEIPRQNFLLGFFLLLFGCSGDGIENSKTVKDLTSGGIAEITEGSVIIYRPKIFNGSGVRYIITVNGERIGFLGIGESAVAELIDGKNYVEAKPALGLFGNGAKTEFQNEQNQNRFFVIKYYQPTNLSFIQGAFNTTHYIKIEEVAKRDWDEFFED